MTKYTLFLLLLLLLVNCYRIPEQIEPQIDYRLEESYLQGLTPAFAPISEEEKKEEWEKEYMIALSFAKDLDLYRAVTNFKRAEILLPENKQIRQLEIQYNILLCYYLGKRFQEAMHHFEKSQLQYADRNFPVFHDLLIILYACYSHLQEEEKAKQVLELIGKHFPKSYQKIRLSVALLTADIEEVKEVAQDTPYEEPTTVILSRYEQEKKSIGTAKTLNAFIPGSGYLYLGQKRAAITSFLINGLFIAATYHFFHNRQIAAGVITLSFEMGWYFGGIYGAGLEARYYNERVYEKTVSPFMNHNRLFPIFMIDYAF